MQRADDALARGSVPGESNEPKGPGDVSRSKGKGKVDPIDKKAEKNRIAAKAKANLKAGRISAFRILPDRFDTAAIPPCPAVQQAVNVPHLHPPRAPSLTPLARLASELSSESSLLKRRCTIEVSRQRASGPLGNSSVRVPPCHDNRWSFSHTDDELPLVSSDIKIGPELIRKIGGIGVKFPTNLEDLLVPDRFLDWSRDLLNQIINSESRIVGAYEEVVADKEDKIKSLLARTDVDAAWKELDRQKDRADSWEVSATANRQSADDYAAQVEVLKEEKQRLEGEVKERDVHLEAASVEIAELRANPEKSCFTEDRLRKKRDGARHQDDEIASGSSV
ncbi:hypothetical protein AALP_AA1G181500 [Arabis alpina]|nr:hypothetical protein AALP_AA1G181500 [Arabis alpina]